VRLVWSVAAVLTAACGGAEPTKAAPSAATPATAPEAEQAVVTPTAAPHERLPTGCTIAANVSVAQLMAHPRVRVELLPLLGLVTEPDAKSPGVLSKFLQHSELKPRSLDALAVCASAPRDGQLEAFAALSGTFAKHTLVPAWRAAGGSPAASFTQVQGRPTYTEGKITAFQADDGTLLSSVGRALDGLGDADQAHAAYALDTTVFASFALAAAAIEPVPRAVLTVSGLDEFTSAKGTITLDPPQLNAVASFASAEAAGKLVIFVDGVRQSLIAKNGENDTYGQKTVLDGIQTTADGATVSVTVPLPIDHAIDVAKSMLQTLAGP